MDSRTCGSRECQRRLKFWIRLSFRFDKVTNIDFQLLIDDFRFDPTACFEVIDTTDTRSTFVQPGVDGIPAQPKVRSATRAFPPQYFSAISA